MIALKASFTVRKHLFCMALSLDVVALFFLISLGVYYTVLL